MRIPFVYRNLNRSGSLERDSVFLLEGLADATLAVYEHALAEKTA